MHALNHHEIILAYIKGNHFGGLLDMDFEILEAGQVSYKVTIEEKHLATRMAAHGGLLAALMDGALGIAALSLVVDKQQLVATVEMNIKYLLPVLLGDEILAKGQVLKAGKRLLFSEVKVYNQRAELIAIGSGTFNAYPKAKVGY